MSTSQDLFELDMEVNAATSTLRGLQRQVAVLRARLSMLDSTENYLSDGAESGGSVSGEDEFGGGDFVSRPRTKYGRMNNGVGMGSVNEYCDSRERMCRFASQSWRPRCWFEHGRRDPVKLVDMANCWINEIELNRRRMESRRN